VECLTVDLERHLTRDDIEALVFIAVDMGRRLVAFPRLVFDQ
jgi:hypothetical protein